MFPSDIYCVSSTSTIAEAFTGNSGMDAITTSGFLLPGNSSASSSGVLDSASALRHEADIAVDWTIEEQYLLEKGLERFRGEPKFMKYIKIAASLPDKTVRDVALRCSWMTRKRRKGEEHSAGKKVSNMKEKRVVSSSNLNIPTNVPQQNALYISSMNNMRHSPHMANEGLSDMVIELLHQNAQTFNQISYNLSARKPQDNISLLCQARNNISGILNDMKEMPGIMSRMPPLPVSIDEELANIFLMSTEPEIPKLNHGFLDTAKRPITYTYSVPKNMNMKQEPRS